MGIMKQQDAYKIMAALMIVIMIGAPLYLLIEGQKGDTTQETNTPDTNLDKYNPDLWTVNQPFYSISDSLKMTPPGAITAQFVDLENMPPQMIQWARQELQVIQEVDSLYKSNTTTMYFARITEGKNDSFLLLSTMFPPKNDFDYIVLPDTNNILQRQDTGAINIMGSPVIYAPTDKTASEVLEIIYGLNKSATSYDQYETLLKNIEPVPYQMVSSNVSFAKQFYFGVGLINGSYERTTAYLDANSTVIKKLNQLKVNGTQKGFEQYQVNQSGNYTVVKIVSPELFTVLDEETS